MDRALEDAPGRTGILANGDFGEPGFMDPASARRGRGWACRIRAPCPTERPTVPELPDKTCAACGRRIAWRRKWARCWEQVRFCGERCRRSRPGPIDAELERAILDLLAARAADATICPSEAARRVAGPDDEPGWRALMEPARQAARRLCAAGQLEITQRGRIVDASGAKGPIRLRRSRAARG